MNEEHPKPEDETEITENFDQSAQDLSNRINYFKTMPKQVSGNSMDLVNTVKRSEDGYTHAGELKSSLNRDRISIVNIVDGEGSPHLKPKLANPERKLPPAKQSPEQIEDALMNDDYGEFDLPPLD
jgi:hypothetical protein